MDDILAEIRRCIMGAGTETAAPGSRVIGDTSASSAYPTKPLPQPALQTTQADMLRVAPGGRAGRHAGGRSTPCLAGNRSGSYRLL
jgi:hypothetical protein